MFTTISTIIGIVGMGYSMSQLEKCIREKIKYKHSEQYIIDKWNKDESKDYWFKRMFDEEMSIIEKRKTSKCRNEHREKLREMIDHKKDLDPVVKSYLYFVVGQDE